MTRPPTPAARTRIGDYNLLAFVAEGGAGVVYKAQHCSGGPVVAVKIMPPVKARHPIMTRRFEQEFHAARQLDHPNIVRACHFGEEVNTPYLVMEFVDGRALGEIIEREGRMAEEPALRIVAQIGLALDYAHGQAIIHRDIKPDNILVTAAGVAKLTDLGLAKEMFANLDLTRTGRGLGTPHFMAPEQFRNAKNADHRSDIYGLAATLYMMLCNTLPFANSNPFEAMMQKSKNALIPLRRLASTVSQRTARAVERAMSCDPGARPASCREFLADLGVDTDDAPPDTTVPLWQLHIENKAGEVRPIKGDARTIRQLVLKGVLRHARKVSARPNSTAELRPLEAFPEFHDVASLLPGEPPTIVAEKELDRAEACVPSTEPALVGAAPTQSWLGVVWLSLLTLAVAVLAYFFRMVLGEWRWDL